MPGILRLIFAARFSCAIPTPSSPVDLEIKGADATRIAAMAGLTPPLRLDAVPVSGAMNISAADGSLDIERLAMTIGGSEVRGKLSLAPAGERRRIAAVLMVGELNIARLLAPVLDQRLAITVTVGVLLSGTAEPMARGTFRYGRARRLRRHHQA
jgi:hypothetical protein